MTSAISSSSQQPATIASSNANPNALTSDRTPSSLNGVVPAQLPVRSYATATKTATPPTLAGASAPAQNAKSTPDAHMNGAMAQNGSQPANGAPNGSANTHDHGRKPSVVISASGASGSYPNGGPVSAHGTRPAISFGSMGASGSESQQNAPFQAQHASLPVRGDNNPRVTSPAHSPSPIPQPPASGGRPPSNLPASNNGGLAFGSMGPDTDMMRNQVPMSGVPAHERRPSSQSMEHSFSNQGRGGFAGRGRGQSFTPQQQFMPSPRQNYMQPMPGPQQGRPQFQQQPPGSPFQHGRQAARQSPAPMHAQPQMPPQPMHYPGYAPHLHPGQQQMYGMPAYDPNSGYYPPYYYNYGQPPQSPRPQQYPSPFQHGTPQGNAPPFHPPATPGMARTPSQASERPSSSMGHPQTPSSNAPVPSGTPGPNQQAPAGSGNFVRPAKKSSAIKITDAQGNAVDFKKPSPTPSASAQPQTPVIVSTPNAPTPPPRVASSQHNRADSQATKSAEERKAEFQRQVQRQAEERNKKAQDDEQVKGLEAEQKVEATKQREVEEKAAAEKAKADAEKAEAAKKKAEEEKSAEAAAKKAAAEKQSDEDAAAAKKKQDDEDMERMIAEMEREDAEREAKEAEAEKAYQEKKAKEKAARDASAAERAAKADEDLKRQEREAEAREEQRERERNGEVAAEAKKDGADDEAKAMFASLKKATIGPGASASGTETPTSERDDEPAESAVPGPSRAGGAQKPKPAHLKLETSKPVERAEPTPGMQALKSARFLELKEEAKYPDGFRSPNPALNQAAQRKGRAYDKDFLLQFQPVFKEKPSVDWDQKVKETLGPGEDSARPQSARTPSGAMGSRQGSGRPGQSMGNFGGAMGNFAGPMGPRTLPAGTTSEQRFQASQMGPPGRGAGTMPRQPSQLGMGAPGVGMSRTNSLQMMGNMGGPNSPRQPSSRGGKGASRRDDRQHSKRQEAEMANKMPLTAHMEITPLEKSQSGWKPMSLTSTNQAAAVGPDPSGLMAPDMVQRKVKAALNKMTPEKFDRISDQILEIAAQSTKESDGRTLRQVIQLTFEKACDEAHWAGMYAKFCQKMLTTMSTDIRDETIKDKAGNPVVGGALFRKYLLNRCQEEFERGWQANLPDKPEGETEEAALLSDEYYIAAAAKRRGLGLIQFIGQLYKLRMLTLRIMHECVLRLLNFEGEPDEAAVENLTTLLKAVGSTMETEEQGKNMLDMYFKRIDDALLKSDSLGSRPRFMILDLIDLRKAGWKGKDDAKGPKTIAQIHEEAEAAQAKAEAERQRTSRGGPGRAPAGRGDARNFSGGMPPPVDYNRTTVGMDDLRRLQARGQARTGGSLGPGGGLGPSSLSSGRTGSRRGAGNLAAGSSANSTRTNTPPVDKKDEPATAQNAFSALASLDASGDQPEEQSEAVSPQAARNRSKSPMAADKDES